MSLARDECFSIIQKAFARALRKKKKQKKEQKEDIKLRETLIVIQMLY